MRVVFVVFFFLFNICVNAQTVPTDLDVFVFSGGSFSLDDNLQLSRHPVSSVKYNYETPENNVRRMSGKYNYKSTTSNTQIISTTDVYVGDKEGKVQVVFEQIRNITNDSGLYSAYPKQGFNYVKLNGDAFEFQIKCTNEPKKNVDDKKCYAVNPEICTAVEEMKKDWGKVEECRQTLSKARSKMMKGEEKVKQQWEDIQGDSGLLINKYAGKSRDPFVGVDLSAMNNDDQKIFEYLETVEQMCDPYKARPVTSGPSSVQTTTGSTQIPQ